MAGEIDVDEIVRAVLRQLPGGPSHVEPPRNENESAANRTLELTDKLVTLATLENRLTTIDRLALRAGAVVTPSALDELRAHGIAIARSAAVDGAKAARATLALGVADCDVSCDVPALVAAIVATGCSVERIAQTGLAGVAAELADQAAGSGRLALLLTSRPAAAACLANRRRGVRAVAGKDSTHLREAIDDVAANLVAVDPAALSAFELRRLASDFCAHWPRPLPKEVE